MKLIVGLGNQGIKYEKIDNSPLPKELAKNSIDIDNNGIPDYIDELPDDKTQPIVVACRKGLFASRIKNLLNELGYKNVFVLAEDTKYLIEAHKAEKGE